MSVSVIDGSKPRFIAVEGPIGVGKTALASRLAESLARRGFCGQPGEERLDQLRQRFSHIVSDRVGRRHEKFVSGGDRCGRPVRSGIVARENHAWTAPIL